MNGSLQGYRSTRFRQGARSWITTLWYGSKGPWLLNPAHGLLWLAAGAYRLGLAWDQWNRRRTRRRLPACTVSVGNLTVGGTGKTPFTRWLVELLRQAGVRVAVLSRGYGRKQDDVARVVPGDGEWLEQVNAYGDEPLLLARRLDPVPIWVGRSRFSAGARALEAEPDSVLVMDDGFQHVGLERDLDIVLLDAARPFGNGHVLPLGPLREPVGHLSRAAALVLTRADDPEITLRTRAHLEEAFPGKPIFSCCHRLSGFFAGDGFAPVPLAALNGKTAIAFAGIAHPGPFFEALQGKAIGLSLVETHVFPDHYAYSDADVDRLLDCTRRHAAELLVTTEKDWIRLPGSLREHVLVATLELDFGSDLGALKEFILTRIHLRETQGT